MRCLNCDLAIARLRRHNISSLSAQLHTVLTGWLAIEPLPAGWICHNCFILLNECANEIQPPRIFGHSTVCLGCGRSLREQRYHTLADDPVLNVILHWRNIQDQVLQANRLACHTCFVRASRHVQRPAEDIVHEILQPEAPLLIPPLPAFPDLHPQPEPPLIPPPPVFPDLQPANRDTRNSPTITMANYKRTPNTSRTCVFQGCTNASYHLIPRFLKKKMLKDHNLYIPRSCRVCELHLYSNEWQDLSNNENLSNVFNQHHLDDLISILKDDTSIFDFENVSEMPDHICHYWTSLTVQEFLVLFSEIPWPHTVSQPKTSLAIYLTKLRTGESNKRLSSLFCMPRSTLEDKMNKVRDVMMQHFVVFHIGTQHINREQIAQRNLILPNALFGNADRPAITICDGTYIFIQKSSNYMYQKQTYSLHKYDNLVKPFILVCTDGHIIDVIGPYAATKSDADIMIELFGVGGPLRNVYADGDLFLLDRGFRDALPMLENMNFVIHKPESLSQGQRQLTTIQANKSRCVTLCRWVVEIVNGRFKRDYKLFRQDFFNRASKHLMADFKIAAALINRFHPLITDRNNVQEIISKVNENINQPNYLSHYINTYNINRVRRFTRIDAADMQMPFPVLSYDDLELISLGPYQIKQARSYFGEHIRANGIYEVQVCTEIEELPNSEELVRNLGAVNPYLLRGIIKSRHVSSKKYYTYILVERELRDNPLNNILQYYCTCLVGNRTVGCCCHVMTIIWYLGWARYENVSAPASFLDNILLTLDVEEE